VTAPAGQISSHNVQKIQAFKSISGMRVSGFSLMAPDGHLAAHSPHPVHFDPSMAGLPTN
jgi:hypothetical protein